MKITFLGTSHGIAEAHAFCSSAVVTVGDKHYVIDAGAPIMTLLQNHGISFWDIQGIFITHSHRDHTLGLVEFTLQVEGFKKQFAGVRIPVYVPDTALYLKIAKFLFNQDEMVNHRLMYRTYEPGVIFDDGTLRITAIVNQHTACSRSFLLEAEGKKVLFTGDLKHDIPDYPAVATEQDLDLIITEGAHTRLNKPEVMEILKSSRTRHMIIQHRYDKYNTDEMVDELRRFVADKMTLTCAHDNDVFYV
ncbi:MAG: MBL fold metallo-hydrolase [Clostridia bacterium]|nr:MBL fold metallo-hydrolase [Clostridia bacterium]